MDKRLIDFETLCSKCIGLTELNNCMLTDKSPDAPLSLIDICPIWNGLEELFFKAQCIQHAEQRKQERIDDNE